MLENSSLSSQQGKKKKTTSSLEFVGGFVESTEVWSSAYFYFDCARIWISVSSLTEQENIGLYHSIDRKIKKFSINPGCLLWNFRRSGKENLSCQYTS